MKKSFLPPHALVCLPLPPVLPGRTLKRSEPLRTAGPVQAGGKPARHGTARQVAARRRTEEAGVRAGPPGPHQAGLPSDQGGAVRGAEGLGQEPDAEEYAQWLKEGRFDYRDIDGTRFYMGDSVRNLYMRYPELERAAPSPQRHRLLGEGAPGERPLHQAGGLWPRRRPTCSPNAFTSP